MTTLPLILIGKLAALYAQNFHDAMVLAAVNKVESLAGGLSRKIWRKIAIFDFIEDKSTK